MDKTQHAESYKKFLEEHRASLQLLGEKIKRLDTVKGISTVKEFQARQMAIKLVEEWIGELWGISRAEDIYPQDEESVFKYLDNSQEF